MRVRYLHVVSLIAVAASCSAAVGQQVIYRATPQVVEPTSAQLSFAAVNGLAVGQQAVSAPARYVGPTLAATASNGEMRVCTSSDCTDRGTGGWASSGSVSSGLYVQVRRPGPTAASQTVKASVSVQNVVAEFAATASGAQPTLASFPEKTVAAGSGTVQSDVVAFFGQFGAALSVSNGEYRLCRGTSGCGSFTSAAGTIDDGDTIQLSTPAPSTSNASKSVSVTAGLASGSWTVRTAKDVSPDGFTFGSVAGVEPGAQSVSPIARLTGHDGVSVSVSGHGSASYQICAAADCSDQATWSSSATTDVPSGRYVRIRVAPTTFAEQAVATLTAGSTTSDWSATARTKDVSPTPLTFVSVPNAPATTLVESEALEITGHDGVALTIAGTGSPSYRLCGDAACSSGSYVASATTLPATPTSRRWIRLSVTSGAAGTPAQTATLSADGVQFASWSVTPVAAAPTGESLSGIIENATLRSTIATYADATGWTRCASTSTTALITSFYADLLAKCTGTKTLIVQKSIGTQYGAYLAVPAGSIASGNTYKTVSGFYFSGASSRTTAIYNMSGTSVSTIQSARVYKDDNGKYFGIEPAYFDVGGKFVHMNKSNGNWAAGYTLDGSAASSSVYPVPAQASYDIYMK